MRIRPNHSGPKNSQGYAMKKRNEKRAEKIEDFETAERNRKIDKAIADFFDAICEGEK